MKKYLSVFTLIARESLFRIPLLWILSAVAQTVSFVYSVVYKDVQLNAIFSRAFEYDGISVFVIFGITLLLTGLLLIKTGMEFRTKSGYTLRRLRIEEKKVFLVQAVYNGLMLFLLILFETVLIFALLNFGYMRIEEKLVTNQSVYLSFYESGFVQNVFSGRDALRAVRNILTVSSLGFSLSAFTFLWRRGKKFIPGVLHLALFAGTFWACPGTESLEWDVSLISVAAVMLYWSICTVMRRGKEYDA